jgi:hypothetical protein
MSQTSLIMILSDQVDVSDFAHPALYPPWAVDPLMVSCTPKLFNKYEMAAAMLSNDQAGIGPIRRMQVGIEQ